MTMRTDLLAEVAARLAAAGVPSPAADARWLVEESGDDPVRLEGLVQRRCTREPLQLVLGTTAFRHLVLRCEPGVFIPRPETEVVAGAAIAAARHAPSPARVLEPCTGTGAIALAIASEVPGVRVVAGDRDPRAIALARRNTSEVAGDLARKATVEVVASDVFDGFPPEWRGSVDVVVCNPPYLPERDATTWEPEVADHDPITALVGGPDGHEVVDAVLAQARDWLRPGGTVVVEIDDRRGAEAADVATALGYVDVHLVADLTGRDRAVAAVHPSGETPGETK